MKKLLVILSSIVLLISCSNNEVNNTNPLIENTNNMANFLFDIHLSEALERENIISSTDSRILYTKLFDKHGISPEQFDSAVAYYADHNSDYVVVYEKVKNKVNQYIYFTDRNYFNKYPAENINIWKDYAVFPKGLYKMTQFLPFYICPKPEYLNKPLIINK